MPTERRPSRAWRLLAGLQASLLIFSLLAPIGAIAATIQTDLFVYNDGDTVTVSGVEYGADETVDVVTTDPAGTEVDRGTAQTDSAGAFTYAFTLRATISGLYDVVATGRSSGLSSSTQFDPPPPVPTNLRFLDAKFTAAGNVVLTWDRVAASTDCYELYRSTSPLPARPGTTGSFICGSPPAPTGNLLATIPQPSSGPVTYTDTAVVPGQTYYYYVTSLKEGNSNQGESANSDQVTTASLRASPNTVAFGNVTIATPASQSVTITNNGLAAITFRSITKTGANQADFVVTGAPAAGSTFATGASFTFSVTFTPGALGSRTATLSVNASDPTHGAGIFNSHLIDVSGTGVNANHNPVANNDSATVGEDSGTTSVNVLTNDTDADGDTLTVASAGPASHGTVGFTSSAATYQPAANYCGPDSFPYSMSDGHGGTASATVNVTVTCVNDPPDAVDDTLIVAEGSGTTSVNVLANDTDVDGDALIVTSAGPASHGTVGFTSTTATYRPNPGYCGPDSFQYSISDGHGGTDTANVSVTVTCVNDPPVVVVSGNFGSVPEGTTRTYTYTITDPDSASFTVTESCGTGADTIDTPAPNSFDCFFRDGPDTTIVNVTADDGGASNNIGSDPHSVSITNVVPTTAYVSGDLTVNESGTVTHTYVFSISDPGDDTVIGTGTTCGAFAFQDGPTIFTDTTITFSCIFPDGPLDPIVQANATDSDTMTGPFASQPVHVNNVVPTTTFVSGDNPVDESDTASHIYVFSIFDPGDDTIIGTGTTCGAFAFPSGPTVFDDDTITFACIFPDGPADYVLQANATDSDHQTGPFTSHTIHANNVPPVATDDVFDADEDFDLVASSVLNDDTDVLGDPLSVGAVEGSAANVGVEITLPSGALLTMNADGSFTYDPNGAFEYLNYGETATDSFTYRAYDGNDLSNLATVTITIYGADDAPVAAAASASVGHLNAGGVDITLSAMDADGDFLIFAIDSFPAHGTLGPVGALICSLGGAPSTCTAHVHYTPNSPSGDFVGLDTFTYHADDGGTLAGNVATVEVTLNNAAPTATVSLAPASPTTNQTLSATATAADADGDTVALTYVWKNGSTVVRTHVTSSLTDMLDLSLPGNGDKHDTITVEVTPNDGHVDGATASDDVTVVNSNPVIALVTAVPNPVGEGAGTLVTVSASDADGDALHYEFNCTSDLDAVYEVGPQLGMSTTCTYDDGPDGHVVGLRVTDGDGGSASATEGVTVLNVPPSGTFSASSPVFEGSPSTLHWSGVSDPSAADTAAGFRYSYACSGNIGDLEGNYGNLAGSTDTSTCTFPDNGSFGVASSVLDKDNASFTTGAGITVLNVDPTLSGVAITSPVVEGGVATLSGSISDPGTDSFSLFVDWGDGQTNTFNYPTGTTSFSETHTYVDDNPSGTAADTYDVDLLLSDDDGGTDTATVHVDVLNIAPTVSTSVADFFVDEGSAATLNGTITDPGVADTFTLTIDWGEGAPQVVSLGASHSFSVSHVYADDNPSGTFHDIYNISWLVVDDDGGGSAGIEQVSVENVPPNPTLVGGDVVEEGSTHHYTFTSTDPGIHDTFSLVGADCGTLGILSGLTFDSSDASGSFDCTFPDDGPPDGIPDGATTIHVEVADDDTSTGIWDIHALVENVAPVVDIGGDRTVNEGDLVAFDAIVTDPAGANDTFVGNVWLVTCDYGQTESQGTFPFEHFEFTPTDNGVCTVELHVSDEDGGEGVDTATVTVHNVEPTATIADTGSVAEGSPVGVRLTNPLDPSSRDTSAAFHYSFACTGGAAALATSYATASTAVGTTCTFGDNGPMTVYGRIFDKDGGSATYTTVITVGNVNPGLNTPTFTFNPFTGIASAGISLSDPGWLDSHSAVFNWGDGTSSPGVLGSNEHGQPDATGTFTAGHAYATGCATTAPSVTITDDDGGSATYAYPGGIDRWTYGFMAPIQDGARNIVKQGNVIPVKLEIRNCTGGAVLGKTLSIGYVQGDVYDDADAGDLQVVDSVSSADSTGFMRQVDGKYMYNLATKTMKVGLPYTVVVREPSTNSFVASFVIQPKK